MALKMRITLAVAAGAIAVGLLTGCDATQSGNAVISPVPVTVTPSPVTIQPTVTVQPPPTVTATQQAPPPVTVTQQAQPPATVTQGPSSADQEVQNDRSVADSTIGHWIPQLSANSSGSEAWSRFVITHGTYSDAFMIWCNDFSTSQTANVFLTLVPREFSTAAEANAWCDSEGFSAGNCFAKRLSHIDGPAGNSVER